jgi:tRNA G18 (ribose-2'-O)-methylase SpoU
VSDRARLVGDGVDHSGNARALADAASMFGIPLLLRGGRAAAGQQADAAVAAPTPTVDTATLLRLRPIVAVENVPGAEPVFTSRLPTGSPTVVVGNERRGIASDVLGAAATCVRIPLSGRSINTLNVAAAAAVALYYLLRSSPTDGPRRGAGPSQRPSVLLLGPGDHVEAGSALRSAAAFGWRAVNLADRNHVWFGTPRGQRTEARAAARAHRSGLRVHGVRDEEHIDSARIIVAGVHADGPPLHRTKLVGGPGTLVVIPDEQALDGGPRDARLVGPKAESARIDLPAVPDHYRYRLTATIVLAEISRQLGSRRPGRPPRQPRYPSAVTTVETDADLVTAAELSTY